MWTPPLAEQEDPGPTPGRNGLAGRPSGRRHTPENFAERFRAHVDKTGPDGCWSWTGTTNGDGRGRVHVRFEGGCKDGKRGKRVRAYAYAIAWQLANGDLPEGATVCHHCDNPNCVNPEHLFIGTQTDNIRDMYAKGRGNSFGWKTRRSSSTTQESL